MKRVYLDHAAATPLAPAVLEAMQPYLRDIYGNPSSLHAEGKASGAALGQARRQIARLLGARASEIIFTSGSTEAANLAIQGVLKASPEGEVVTTGLEHEAVLRAIEAGGSKSQLVEVPNDGIASVGAIRAAISDQTVLICLQYVNNEIGTIQPVSAMSKIITDVRAERLKRGVANPLYLYCDAAQAGLMPLAVHRLGVDLLSMGGSKIYGPHGSGFLYIRTGTKLRPMLYGGGQEIGLRAGTENVAGAVGLASALEYMQSQRAEELRRQADLSQLLWQEIKTVPGLKLNGSLKSRHPSNLNFSVRDVAGETLVAYLDAAGFAIATGSACSVASQDPSHVLLAIGCCKEEAESSLRVTVGLETTTGDVETFAKALKQAVADIRSLT